MNLKNLSKTYALALFALTLVIALHVDSVRAGSCPRGDCATIVVHGIKPPDRNTHNTFSFPPGKGPSCQASCHSGGALDPFAICRFVRGAQPSDCDTNTPPKSPEYRPYWQGNGCGDGSFGVKLAEAVVNASTGGSMDAPIPGISFRSACNTHDYCYGIAGSRGGCDSQFRHDMLAICSSYGSNSCTHMANIYANIVRDHGQSAHERAANELRCDIWNSYLQYCSM